MDTWREPQDDEVIRLLGMMRDSGPEYPSNMFSKRRAAVMAAFAALNLGAATAGLSLIAHLVKIIKGMGIIEKIILGVEVAAVTGMTAYGAATAYRYRYEIRQLLENQFGITTNTPFPTLMVPGGGPQATALSESETPSPTPTPTGTLLYTPTNPPDTPPPGSTQPPPTIQPPTTTPPPPTQPPTEPPPTTCGNSGLCKGWTKTPRPTPQTKP